jgi:hypothetical protein
MIAPFETAYASGVNDNQRILLVVALGFAGWFAYAPNTGVSVLPDHQGDYLRSGLMGGLGVGVWTAVSYRLLRRPTPTEQADPRATE